MKKKNKKSKSKKVIISELESNYFIREEARAIYDATKEIIKNWFVEELDCGCLSRYAQVTAEINQINRDLEKAHNPLILVSSESNNMYINTYLTVRSMLLKVQSECENQLGLNPYSRIRNKFEVMKDDSKADSDISEFC